MEHRVRDTDPVRYGSDLDEDHPGFADAEYRARRAEIGRVAEAYERGGPVPDAPYSDEEHEVWRLVSAELGPKHQRYACAEYLEAKDRLGLPLDRVPQLSEVGDLLHPHTGFRYEPVSGLVGPRFFYESLGQGWFPSTQYIRHASAPYYTPEPDVIHEVIGHGNQLASPAFAELYRKVGRAVSRTTSDAAVQLLSRVFWFTVEFGVVREDGEVKAYGAGILSSSGELEEFRNAEVRPVDFAEMGHRAYDITHYQPVLYAFDGFAELTGGLGEFLDSYDEDAFARLHASAA